MTLTFEGVAVERVSSGRADQITAEVVDNTIRLWANWSVVNLDSSVTVGGRTALFTLQSDSTSQSPRIYLVHDGLTNAKRR